MKRLFVAILIFTTLSAEAAHIKGGFFTYRYLGPGNNGSLRYNITLTVYMICNPSDGQVDQSAPFSIFDAGNNQLLQTINVSLTNQYDLGKTFDEPCISGNQVKCYYRIVVYNLASVELPANPQGYIISYQRCCRISGIQNVVNSGAAGNTFSIKIPGTSVFPGAETNSSPMFLVNDTAVVCRGSYFQYSFQATDADASDSLSYSFCQAFNGGGQSNGNCATCSAPNPATNPPHTSIPYQSPFSGAQPMGAGVTINPVTGIISGIAPNNDGEYVICICVNEYRNGILIGTTRKELHMEVSDCQPLSARLDPKPSTCDGFTVNFSNDHTTNPAGTEHVWTFGEPSSGSADTAYTPNPSHTYSAAGDYTVKLIVSFAGGLCADTASFITRVYPGFFPDFSVDGKCLNMPFEFTDLTTANYGVVNTWSWNFGDITTLSDTSHLQNPQWTYAQPGTAAISFIVGSSMGCIDTVQRQITVLEKPPLDLAFKDTLICIVDDVQLIASGSGQFSWTPNSNITGANTATPTVDPDVTTWYHVTMVDDGCINNDSVLVRVIDFVSLNAMADTTICQGDPIQLNAVTDGLSFAWTPEANLDNPFIINPIAVTINSTTYQITSTVGSCTATDFVTITSIPYPIANAGIDPTICYNTSVQLNASIVGSSFNWSPVSYLSNPAILNPVVTPPRTTQYVLAVYDTLGCPKPGLDTIVVNVNPKVNAFAGRDTIVIVNQPLQFNASGGVNYTWTPSSYLSNPTIYNPVGIYGPEVDSIQYKLVVTDDIGCADSAYVTVKVFKTEAAVFVPTAFTPNNDGLNDRLAPISVGIERINYFSVFNRWGQLVFTTSRDRHGWDGTIGGKPQGSGVFVWMVSAIDYTGQPVFFKGTSTLIR